MKSWYTIRARASGAEGPRADVLIHDEIGAHGVSAKGFLAELGALPGEAAIDLRINSPGGSVFDAIAIHNALQRHAGTVTVWIDGIAASAASYVAMAGDEIVMPENAFLMIHDPGGLVMGTATDMRAMAEALDKVKGSLVSGYAAKSGRTADEVSALMAAETWFDAAEALAQGFADRVIEPVRIAARFDIGRFRNAPPALVADTAARDAPDQGDAGQGAGDDERDPAHDEDGVEFDGSPGNPVANTAGHVADANMPPQPDAVAIRAEAIAHARAVVDLCRLAGLPQMAGRFLEAEASLDAVRTALLAAKAEAEPEIAPHHPQPGRTQAARPWGEIVARTFPLKG